MVPERKLPASESSWASERREVVRSKNVNPRIIFILSYLLVLCATSIRIGTALIHLIHLIFYVWKYFASHISFTDLSIHATNRRLKKIYSADGEKKEFSSIILLLISLHILLLRSVKKPLASRFSRGVSFAFGFIHFVLLLLARSCEWKWSNALTQKQQVEEQVAVGRFAVSLILTTFFRETLRMKNVCLLEEMTLECYKPRLCRNTKERKESWLVKNFTCNTFLPKRRIRTFQSFRMVGEGAYRYEKNVKLHLRMMR